MGVLLRCVSAISVLLFLSANSYAQSANPFFVPPTIPGSGQDISADLNGDGKPDLVFLDGTVLLGKGDGTFTVGKPWQISGTSTASQFAIADFNGDGKPDLLIAGPLNAFSVLLGNGDGTFQTPVTTNIASPATSFVVGDLNGDGKPDVLAQVGSMFLSYLGHGDGTFSAGVVSNAIDASIFDSFADFNGDGKLDLFVLGQGIQLGNGNGTFQALLPFPAGALIGGAVGDFDGDGKLDVAAFGGTSASPEIQVLFGKGDGTFRTGTVQELPSGISGGNPVADFTNDGKADLIASSASAVGVLKSNGDGTFTVGKFYNAQQGGAGSIVIADFNGDGRMDVAAFNTILLGNGDGSLQGDEAVPALTGTDGVTGDFNGDGHPDLALFSNSGGAATVNVWLNDGKANFTLAHTYQIPVPVPGNFGGEVVITGALDLNGDGKIDLVGYVVDASGWSVIVLLGNGDGSFGSPITTPGGQLTRGTFASLAVGDLNGDGKPDVMILAGTAAGFSSFNVLLGNGDGTFGAPVSAYAPGAFGVVLPGDFNKDGKLDIIVGTNNGIAVLLGNGDGTFQPTTFITNSACGTNCNNLAAADFNGDGNADLIVAVPGGYQVLIGKGDGTFSALPPVSDTVGAFNVTLQVADFNGDGKLDVLGDLNIPTNPLLGLILGNGDGTFSSPLALTLPNNTLIGDFNEDGRPDIAVLSSTQLVWLFNTTAPGFVVSVSTLSASTVAAGGSSSATITVARQGGFNGNVTLSCSGLTDGVSCGLAPASIPGGAGSSTLTISTTASTPPNTYAVNVLGTSGTVTSQQVVMLTVTAPTAPDFSVTPGSGGTATVAPGQTATYTLSLAPSGEFSGSVTLTCSGAPAMATCSISPATVTLSGTTATTATVAVTTTAAAQVFLPGGTDTFRRIGRPPMVLAAWLVTALALFSLYRARGNQRFRWAPAVAMALLVFAGLGLASCGGGNSSGGGRGGTGTEAGTYTITVSASATAGSTTLNHATKLTLVVQ